MNGQQIIDLFNSLIDDSLDNDTALSLANAARVEIEGERNWECLKKKDSSQNSLVGDTYATEKALPADYRNTIKIVLANYQKPLDGISFEDQEDYKDEFGYFFLDVNANKLHLTGSPDQDRQITHFYKITSPAITLSTAWQFFHEDYHPLLAYRMAAKFYNIDFSDISAQVAADRMWVRNAAILQDGLNKWDDMLKYRASASKAGYRSYNDPSRI